MKDGKWLANAAKEFWIEFTFSSTLTQMNTWSTLADCMSTNYWRTGRRPRSRWIKPRTHLRQTLLLQRTDDGTPPHESGTPPLPRSPAMEAPRGEAGAHSRPLREEAAGAHAHVHHPRDSTPPRYIIVQSHTLTELFRIT